MKYSVLWSPEAEQQIAALWIDSRFRNQLTSILNEADDILASSPLHAGESRDERRRLLIYGPFSIFYFVDENKRNVLVTRVILTRKI